MVVDDSDVAAQHPLHRHRLLGPQKELVTVEMRVEAAPVLGHFAELREGEHLKTARIREYRTIPPHKLVKPACRSYDLSPRPEHEVVGVAEHHLSVVLLQIARFKGLYRALRAHIHENRSLHDTMRCREPSKPRFGGRISLQNLETH